MRRLLLATTALCLCIAPVALAGPKTEKEAKKDSHDCSTCKDMEKSGNGWCEHCKMGMVAHVMAKSEKLYKAMKDSTFAKTLAAGMEVKASDIKCADCKKMVEGHKDGFCKKCDGGLVMGHFFKGKEGYEKAEHAMKVMTDASKARCGGCATAMVSDGKCDHCKVAYKDGKKTKA